MSLKDDLENEVSEVFRQIWTQRDGLVVRVAQFVHDCLIDRDVAQSLVLLGTRAPRAPSV